MAEYFEVLIAEDEADIAHSVKKVLLEEGYHAVIANSGSKVLHLIEEIDFDLILMDYMLPEYNGIELTKIIRERGINIPIIFLTAIDDVDNKITALELGADDYITKPFEFEELLARIHAIKRRIRKSEEEMEFSDYRLNLFTRELKYFDMKLSLTDREFELLKYLVENKGNIVSREEICKNVWGYDFNPQTNIVEVTIRNLRLKFEELSGDKFIKTIYGEGFLVTD